MIRVEQTRVRDDSDPATLLFQLLSGDDTARTTAAQVIASLDTATLDALLALAGEHIATPALWAALGDAATALPPDHAAFLEAASHLNRQRNDRIVAQAREIVQATAAVGIAPVFLKGTAALLSRLYPDPAARFVGDIDLLVPADRLEDAAAALAATGYRRLPDRADHAHDPLRLVRDDRPGLVELHRAPVAFALAAALSAAEVMARAVHAAALPDARIPCPEDRAVHAIAHAMLQDHGLRRADLPLRDALDLRFLAERHAGSIDWPTVASRLSRVPDGSDAVAFCLLAVREAFAVPALPAPVAGPFARRSLAAWRQRRGRPASGFARGTAFLGAYARDCLWRLRHVPSERRHLLRRAFSPAGYPAFVRSLAGIATYGPPATRHGPEPRP